VLGGGEPLAVLIAELEVDEDEAAQQPVVEDQVDVEVIALQGEPSLSCDDAEALAELEQERLDPIDDRLLEVALEPGGPFLQIEELEDLRQSLEQEGCDLPLQLSDGPALL